MHIIDITLHVPTKIYYVCGGISSSIDNLFLIKYSKYLHNTFLCIHLYII